MDQLHTMRVFLAVAETNGFASAARALGISTAAVTRAVSALEAHLEARLLTRSTRHVSLTDAGARYSEDCRRILAEVEEAGANAKGLFSAPRGLLTITAPSIFGRKYVTPIILKYLERYEQVEVRTVFIDRKVNIIEEGIDAAVRIGTLTDSILYATRVGVVRQVLCASPDYLKKAGTPKTPDDLREHRLVSSGAAWNEGGWRFGDIKGSPITARFITDSNDTAITAALAGWGITRVLSYQVADEISSGTLVPILTGLEVEEPIHVVHVEGRRASAKVRAFVDLAVEKLSSDKRLR